MVVAYISEAPLNITACLFRLV